MEGFKLVFFGASVLLLATRVLAREFLLDVPNGSIQWKPPRSQNGSGIIKFRVQMELEAKKWVAVGFSPRGDMFDGGDFCVLWTDPNGLFELNSMHQETGSNSNSGGNL
ncbi:unnamed protein product [Cyprideis torosa]|uniref:Uncharacterized protein n=1 Tax=Cyprideis torosa TaxID=163714 RepID=A0A7R8ZVY9_9CRUS|nr:unnamed protein product [Cyprideis torosa]CAG0908251.1 unnamed protein product [Cyprideis torosa]